MRMLPLLAGPLLCLAFAGAAHAQAGDAASGLKIAQERCVRCHDIARGGAFKKSPPSFQAIAIYRTRADIWGKVIAPAPHSGMPDVSWSMMPEEVQDVVSYITSLDVPVTYIAP